MYVQYLSDSDDYLVFLTFRRVFLRLVSVGRDKTLRVWDMTNVTPGHKCDQVTKERSRLLVTIDLCGSPSAVRMRGSKVIVAVKSRNFENVRFKSEIVLYR